MGFPLFHLRLWTSETMYVLVRFCVNAIFFSHYFQYFTSILL